MAPGRGVAPSRGPIVPFMADTIFFNRIFMFLSGDCGAGFKMMTSFTWPRLWGKRCSLSGGGGDVIPHFFLDQVGSKKRWVGRGFSNAKTPKCSHNPILGVGSRRQGVCIRPCAF